MKTITARIFLLLLAVLIIVSLYIFVVPYFKSSEVNLEKVTSEVSLNSNLLVSLFIANEEASYKLYAGKVIEVSGFVKEISFLNNRNTVLLYTENKESGIICDIHESQLEKVKKLKKDQKIKIKGICKGFLKDVILLNCYIDLKTNEKE